MRFSIKDVLQLLFCAFLLSSLVLPMIAYARSLARGGSCAENLRLISLAAHQYHSTFDVLPTWSGGSGGSDVEDQSNQYARNGMIALLYFLEEQPLWTKISNPFRNEAGKEFPPMGPAPWFDPEVYTPWKQRPQVFACPEDAGATQFPLAVNYAFSLGDGISGAGGIEKNVANEFNRRLTAWPDQQKILKELAEKEHLKCEGRAGFRRLAGIGFREMIDGTSTTLMFAEQRVGGPTAGTANKIYRDVEDLASNPSLCLTAAADPASKCWEQGRGHLWTWGSLRFAAFQSVLPPNSPSCTSDIGDFDGVMSASSVHPGGVYVSFMDGRVMFIVDEIDAGNSRAPSVSEENNNLGTLSPYGLWGALGSRAGSEFIPSGEKAIRDPATVQNSATAQNSPTGAVMSSPQVAPAPRNPNPAPAPAGPTVKPNSAPAAQNAANYTEMRLWKDAGETRTLEASFVRVIDKKLVELKTKDGRVIQVPLHQLSPNDVYFAVEADLAGQTKFPK